MSHLRAALHGQLSSRPYRLSLPVHTDVGDVLAALRAGDVRAAVAAYGGDLMPGTEAPGLVETGTYLAVSLREALIDRADPEAVLGYSDLVPHDTAVLEACLDAPGNRDHPATPLLRARLLTGH